MTMEQVVAALSQLALTLGEEVVLPEAEALIARLQARVEAPVANAIDNVVDVLEDAKFGQKP